MFLFIYVLCIYLHIVCFYLASLCKTETLMVYDERGLGDISSLIAVSKGY